MFHAFQMYVAYVLSGCYKSRSGVHILQWLYTYVASVCFICMLQMFYIDITYVVVAIYVCCKCMFQIFYLYVAYISSGCYKSRSGLHMLQLRYMYVASVCFICTLQVFYMDIAYVAVAIHICCKCMF
jgi:hypothetical protein